MKFPFARLAPVLALLLPLAAWPQVSVSINIAPPPLLVYDQPQVPGEGYIWVPGYWTWSRPDRAYYWVPGTWVQAPNDGDLWTPGYWAFENLGYFWHTGYWGPQVGFYGGINYGYGYSGSGYQGGRWDRGAFRYNRAVTNVNLQVINNYYGTPGAYRQGSNRISFNGGRAGVTARPTDRQRQWQSAEHAGPQAEQLRHESDARGIPTQRWNGSQGVPQVAATPRPTEFAAPGAEHVRSQPGVRQGRGAAAEVSPNPALRPAAEPPRQDQRGQAGRPDQPQPARTPAAARPSPAPAPAPAPATEGSANPALRNATQPPRQEQRGQADAPPQARTPPAARPARAPATEGSPNPALRPAAAEPPRPERQAAPQQARPAAQAPREPPPQKEQRGSGGNPNQPQQEGPRARGGERGASAP
jgi:hypothetical protein